VSREESARVRLRFLGEERAFDVPLRVGESTVVDALPSAYSVIEQAAKAAIEAVGKPPTCAAGCGACCRHHVMMSVAEARALVDAVEAMPEERRAVIRKRFADALARVEKAGILGPKGARAFRVAPGNRDAQRNEFAGRYFALKIACPFLEDESCSIHPVRPLVCREYLVTSDPKHCANFNDPKIDMVPELGVTRAMGRAAKELAETEHEGVPMLLIFEWMEEEGAKLDEPVDGVEVFRAFLGELGETKEKA